jgi:hypothetical protein
MSEQTDYSQAQQGYYDPAQAAYVGQQPTYTPADQTAQAPARTPFVQRVEAIEKFIADAGPLLQLIPAIARELGL